MLMPKFHMRIKQYHNGVWSEDCWTQRSDAHTKASADEIRREHDNLIAQGATIVNLNTKDSAHV